MAVGGMPDEQAHWHTREGVSNKLAYRIRWWTARAFECSTPSKVAAVGGEVSSDR